MLETDEKLIIKLGQRINEQNEILRMADKLQVSLLDICNLIAYASSCQFSKGATQ